MNLQLTNLTLSFDELNGATLSFRVTRALTVEVEYHFGIPLHEAKSVVMGQRTLEALARAYVWHYRLDEGEGVR